MRISDLSRKSKVATPTIKFYLREGLLPPGFPTARNQARYDEQHLTRLRFIRTLITVGRLPLSTVREVLAAVDATDLAPDEQCRMMQRSTLPDPTPASDEASAPAVAKVREFMDGIGWTVHEDSPGVAALAQIVEALYALGWNGCCDVLSAQAEAAQTVARRERTTNRDLPAATNVACYVLFGMAFNTLHGLAHEDLLAVTADRQCVPPQGPAAHRAAPAT